MAAAMGLVGGLPTGLKGDPDSDDDWFNTDWMDTTRAQEVLKHQQHSWPDMLIETANKAGASRHLLRVAAPLTKAIFTRRAGLSRPHRALRRPVGCDRGEVGRPATGRRTQP